MIKLLTPLLFLVATTLSAAESLPVIVVQPHAVALTFAADALIEAVQQSTVAAQVAGRVLEVKADAGQAVRKGEVLMRLDSREATENVAAAEARYSDAKAALERSQRLVERKFLSPAALDRSKADFAAAAANRSALAAAQSHAVIVAPISGIVARRHSELGDMAQPGKLLFTIYAPGELRAVVSVPQYRWREMRSIREARIEFPELGRWLASTSVVMLPMADAGTHVAQVRVALPARTEALVGVTPGMFARVHFVSGQAEKLTVPAVAVVRRGEVSAVYVQGADGNLSLRQLRLGEAVGSGEIEVLAGLAAGEKVVSDPVKAAIAIRTAKQAGK